ncbi:MAG: pyrroline-5-carboxylate reductase [Anaerovoracaceae bacterium]
MKIGFIGAGNMGGAILRGYLNSNERFDDEIFVCGRDKNKLEKLKEELGVKIFDNIEDVTLLADVLIIGVKPNMYEDVLPRIKTNYQKEKVIVSMAAGISIGFIESFLGKDAKIIRIMPNTPARVNEGMTSISKNKNVDDEIFLKIIEIFKGIGEVEEVTEDLIHDVIGVSGSSPAYTYMFIEALANSAEKYGMDSGKARKFAAQAVLGAAKMVLESEESLEQLRVNVCSPNGTTIEAVNTLMDNGFMKKVEEGFDAAVKRSKEMEK